MPAIVTADAPTTKVTTAGRTDAEDYVLIRYVAPRPLPVDPNALLAARIGPPGVAAVYAGR